MSQCKSNCFKNFFFSNNSKIMKQLLSDFYCSLGHTGYLPVEVKDGRLQIIFWNSKLRCRAQIGHFSLSYVGVLKVGFKERPPLTYPYYLGGLRVVRSCRRCCVPNDSRCAGTVEIILELSCLAKQNNFLGREYIIPRN